MAVGETSIPDIVSIPGLRIATAAAGVKAWTRDDVVLFSLDERAEVAAVFTRNAFCAAPVTLARRHLGLGSPRALLINAGNANAGTGARGIADARRCCEGVAAICGLQPEQVLPFSTGVIGEHLPVERICSSLPGLVAGLSPDGWQRAARAILTTDTRPKVVSRSLTTSGGTVRLTGIAKGSGMIRPDMATMLAFLATDAKVEAAQLQALLKMAVDRSFNRITVDGDTSTNDAAVLAATGTGRALSPASADWEPFCEMVTSACVDLAQAIVADGEGATRFIAIRVRGGRSAEECLAVAYAVAESPLVKTACFAGDANWGRILAAIGRAGLEDLALEGVELRLNGVLIAAGGARAEGYTEQAGAAAMAPEQLEIAIELGRGKVEETVWTTDLSHDYIRINAEYRT